MTDITSRLAMNVEWLMRDGFETSAKNASDALKEIRMLRSQLAEYERADEEHERIAHHAAELKRQIAECERERDQWKSEALDHCEKVVNQANAALSDRHYMRVMDDRLAELTSFVKRVASLPEHGAYAAELKRQLAELDMLRTQVRELRGERDELVDALQQISKTSDQDASIRAEIRWEIAESALAKLGADKT